MPRSDPPQSLFLERRHWVPNNPVLPVLIYRRAIVAPPGDDTAEAMERCFEANGWPPRWRNGIYSYHHYHATAHEVLGFAAGSARVALGGPGGPELDFATGDVLVLPAGTGHCKISASDDLLVIGAYPPGQDGDIARDAPDAATVDRMLVLAFPQSDPLAGAGGPLPDLWRSAT